MQEAASGGFPGRVPVTALAQLSVLHSERAPWVIPKARMKDKNFIVATRGSKWRDCFETAFTHIGELKRENGLREWQEDNCTKGKLIYIYFSIHTTRLREALTKPKIPRIAILGNQRKGEGTRGIRREQISSNPSMLEFDNPKNLLWTLQVLWTMILFLQIAEKAFNIPCDAKDTQSSIWSLHCWEVVHKAEKIS
jgi:hypothetical protein